MIIRIFVALLVLNLIAFAVRAEASERAMDSEFQVEDLYVLQERMSGDFEQTQSDQIMTVGSRLLSLSLTDQQNSQKKTYASDPARADHGISLLQEGACLNLKWNF